MPLRLPRLQRLAAITERDGSPSRAFHQWFDTYGKNIEDAFAQLEATVTAIAAAQAAADAANAAAATAEAAAATAQSAADAVSLETSLNTSYVTGLTLTASDAGTNATITISAHTRVYGDGTSLAVSGGSLTALSYSTLYYVYYVDATRADTTPTYQATTDPFTAAQTGDTHLVGSVTTPAAAAGNTTGGGTQPPGIGNLP